MTTKENPAPRDNADGRGNSKTEPGQNSGSKDGWKARSARARPAGASGLGDGLRKSGPIDFEAINRAALAAFPAVLARILPGGKRLGTEYLALNPRRADRHLGSFKVNRQTGRWADFATGDRGGDPVSLVAYLTGVSQGEAARLLAQMLGIEGGGRRHG
jgi:hypothetical protein